MPHFGAPYNSVVHRPMTSALLSESQQLPRAITAAVNPQLAISRISRSVLAALFAPRTTATVQLNLQLVTVPSPAALQLTGGKAHESHGRTVRFEIVDPGELPPLVPLELGQDYLDLWWTGPWGQGLVLSRRYIGCAAVP